MRFCFLPASAITPQQFHCLPADPTQEDALQPKFVILRYGHPSYGLLSGDTPMAIWTGADNGSQIGVYNLLQETQAVRNVQLRAQEYVPFGLEAGVFLEPSRAGGHQAAPICLWLRAVKASTWNLCGDVEEDDLRFVGVGAALI